MPLERPRLPRGARLAALAVIVVAAACPTRLRAEGTPLLRGGFAIGIGMSSMTQGIVSLGERPGGISASLESVYEPHWSVALDHTRTFTIMPISSNVSFTGFTMRYYWDTPFPKPEIENEPWAQSHWAETKRSPFFAFGGGYAQGAIGKVIEGTSYGISGDGPYMTLRVGADYPWGENRTYRLELGLSSVVGAVGGLSMVTVLFGIFWGM
jgi:hypothetical protein